MARKAKPVVVSPVAIANESGEVTQVEVGGKVLDVIDLGPVESELVEAIAKQDGLTIEQAQDLVEVAQLVTDQPSLMSQLVSQVVEAAETAETPVVVKSDKNEGVGQFIRGLISEGLGNKAILDIVHEQYGNKNTTYACVAWYRNKMKKAGTVQQVTTSLDWLQNFAKANGLSEESTSELGKALKVA